VLGIIGFLVSAFIAYWIIRWGVFTGMADFEKWKRKRYGDDQYGQHDQHDQHDQYDEQT
jgi:hypothetical protein